MAPNATAPVAQRSARWNDTHARIIDAAAKLFYAQGINTVGVDTIVAAAGVTKATLYSHFPSKDELVAACLETLDLRYHDWFVHEVSSRTDDPVARLRVAFEVLGDWFHHRSYRGCTFINAAVELADAEHPGHKVVRAHKTRTIHYLRELLAEAGLDDDELARQLMLLMEGATVTAFVQDDLEAGTRAAAIATRLLDTWQRPAQPPRSRSARA